MIPNRFAYDLNLERATHYGDWRSAFWPPAADYRLFCLDLASATPALGPELLTELDSLTTLIDAAWQHDKALASGPEPRIRQAGAIAAGMRRIAALLPEPSDRRALELRAHALEHGYGDSLATLAELDEDITLVAGRISTWYGKQTRGLPTAFGCARDHEAQAAVRAATARLGELADYVRALHSQLRLGEIPAFSATQLFFMAGEGNRHPKHIAYFLPEDEGVKRSPFKKTYYFVNTHRLLVDAVSLPLARQFLELGRPIEASVAALEPIPTLGVLAHEIGHFVRRPGVKLAPINEASRWASVMLQETAADVFGTLLLAEVLAPALHIEPAQVILYHLAECLRYVDRGLGSFPDSDGMFLQLQFLASFGALGVEPGAPRLLQADPEVVVAGFRALARVLADTLLAGDVERSLALWRTYGPAGERRLGPLVAALDQGPHKTIEYRQERPPHAPRPR